MPKREQLSWWDRDAASPPLANRTIGRLLDEAVKVYGEQEAVASIAQPTPTLDVRWTYRDLRDRAERAAKGLLAIGLEPGDRVAVWAANVPDWLAIEFAVAKAGLVLVTVNPTLKADEVHFILEDADVRALFYIPQVRYFDLAAQLRPILTRLEGLRYVFSLGGADDVQSFENFLGLGKSVSPEELTAREHAVDADDVAQIQYTSGTTGRPKGAQIAHRGIVNNARLFAQRWRVTTQDRWCNPMPLFHTAGCGMVTLGAMAFGACHLPVAWFDADLVLDVIQREAATIVETVPTMLLALLDRSRETGKVPRSLRLVGIGGAPTPPDLGHRVREEWGAELRIVYGLTETSPLITSVGLDDDEERLFTTVGRPLPEVEVKVVDRRGAVAPTGQPGELCARGYLVMNGYLNQPEATAEVVESDGWFHTGDVATMDDDGFVRIVGRVKDIIIRGGENLYPAEIESILLQHPAVLDVAIVGVPDRYYGEEACAAVRASTDIRPEELREWLRERVSHQKVPRYVVMVSDFPLTASGKVQKFRLRDQIVSELGLIQTT
jgi:acyl-CoA synthetase (AMP-forming)/AMP-acid ligase II